MKKFHSLQFAFLFILLSLGYNAAASLPPIGPDAFPITVSGSNYDGLIDVDNNGTVDFAVYYSGSGSYVSCYLSAFNSSSGSILTEFESFPPVSPAPASVKQPLTDLGGQYFTTLLPYGSSISGVLSGWNSYGYILYPLYSPGSPLTSSSQDGLSSGYVGVYFTGNTGYYYGWLNVTINSSGASVTINSAGSASVANDPVSAGLNDPFAVPFPLIASILGFALVGGGVWLKRKRKK